MSIILLVSGCKKTTTETININGNTLGELTEKQKTLISLSLDPDAIIDDNLIPLLRVMREAESFNFVINWPELNERREYYLKGKDLKVILPESKIRVCDQGPGLRLRFFSCFYSSWFQCSIA